MSTPRDQLGSYVREWIKSAGNDRESLRLLGEAGPPPSVAFHAQQAVEKLLKALLISYGVHPAETHVVGDLLGQVHRFDRRLAERLGQLDRLTRYAVTTRYPDRPTRPPITLEVRQVAADVAMAQAACAVLDEALAARLTALSSAQ